MTYREQLQERINRLDRLPPDVAELEAKALIEKIDAKGRNGDVEAGETTPSRADYKPFAVDRRVAGLGKGTVEMAPDFDAPLPDAFWLGEE